MALQYIEDNIDFKNIIPITRSDGVVPTYKKYMMEDGTIASININNGYIQEPEQTYINSIDIHWGGPNLKSNISNNQYPIFKTSDLLNYTQNKVNENDFIKLLNYFIEVDDTLTKTLTQNSLILGLKNQRKVLCAYYNLGEENYSFMYLHPETFLSQNEHLFINYNTFINNYTTTSNNQYIIPNFNNIAERIELFIEKDLNNENNNQIPYINDGIGEIIFTDSREIIYNNTTYIYVESIGKILKTYFYIN